MTDREARDWLDAALAASRGSSVRVPSSPCADCHAAFAAEMRAEGRCDGEPGPATHRPGASVTSERRREQLRAYARSYRQRARAGA